jgi:CBS domain-containing protein
MPIPSLSDPIGLLSGAPVATIRPTQTLRDAVESLAAENIGILVVADASGVRGVISERDIVMAIAEDTDLSLARVVDYMTADLVQVSEDVTVADAAQTMAASQIRHLAVTRNDTVTGVVSVREILKVLVASRD